MSSEEKEKEKKHRYTAADGSEYALASEVATSLGITVSRLLELHPTMPWRTATITEKKEIAAQGLISASFVTLISIAELDALGWTGSTEIPDAVSAEPASKVDVAKQPFVLTRSRKATGGALGRTPPDKRARLNSRHRATNVLAPYFAAHTACASDADSMPMELVPVRLNIDKFGIRVRETFTWNKNDQTVRPKAFAIQFCHDEELPDVMVAPITMAIEQQLRMYTSASAVVAAKAAAVAAAAAAANSRTMMGAGSSSLLSEGGGGGAAAAAAAGAGAAAAGAGAGAGAAGEATAGAAAAAATAAGDGDEDEEDEDEEDDEDEDDGEERRSSSNSYEGAKMVSRVTKIQLSLQVGSTTLNDCFFWDHAEPNITPESFAAMMCSDLGLAGEYLPKIAHGIREHLLADRQAAMQEMPGEEETPLKIRNVSECFRIEDGDKWSPVLQHKGATEYERRSLQEALEGRLQKRAHDTSVEDAAGAMSTSRRAGRPRKEVSYAEVADVEMDELMGGGGGRRSGRSRKDVLYAPAPRGGVVEAPVPVDPNKLPVVVDYTDTAAFPRIERGPASKPSEEVLRMLAASQGGTSSSSTGGTGNIRPALSAAELEMLETLRYPTKKKASKEAEDAMDDSIADKQFADTTMLMDQDRHSMYGGGGGGGGPVKLYKDNAFNRRLGRVGQVKDMKRGEYNKY